MITSDAVDTENAVELDEIDAAVKTIPMPPEAAQPSRYSGESWQALDATRDSRDRFEERHQHRFPVDVSRDYTVNCLSDERHATSAQEVRCDGWINPGCVVRECRCACHEVVPRASYHEARRRAEAR